MRYDRDKMRVWTATNAINNFKEVVVYDTRVETSKCEVLFERYGVTVELKDGKNTRHCCFDQDDLVTNEFLMRVMQ